MIDNLFVLVSAVDLHLAARDEKQGVSSSSSYSGDECSSLASDTVTTTSSSSSISDSSSSSPSSSKQSPSNDALEIKLKPFQIKQWNLRYKELLSFIAERGHAAVPHKFPENPQLARWVKRQRWQYKLRNEGKPSSMTAERIDILDAVGFVWDSHDVKWDAKRNALLEFRAMYGHCDVPIKYEKHNLGMWVKCQRRQHKLFITGKPASICAKRIQELEKIGFKWDIRSEQTKC